MGDQIRNLPLGDDLRRRLVQRAHASYPRSRFDVLSSQDLRSLPGTNRCLLGSCAGPSQRNHGSNPRQNPNWQERSITCSIVRRSLSSKKKEKKENPSKARQKRKKKIKRNPQFP